MKKTHALILIGLLALGCSAWAGETEDAITAAEQQWIKAELANNADLSAPLFADTAVFGGVDGKVRTKAEFVATEKATKYEERRARGHEDHGLRHTRRSRHTYSRQRVSARTGNPLN
jgi:hypothetical protein